MAKWKNWSGAVSCQPEKIVYPRSQEEIITVIQEAKQKGKNIRVVGSGHSFTPLVETNSIIMSLDQHSGVTKIDFSQCQAWVHAGTKLYLLNPFLNKEGMAMENLGDIDRQSIAGAISTGTHGTGINFRNISSQAIALTLVTAQGEVIECSEKENVEVFKAAQVSLGALGIISEIKLQLIPKYHLQSEKKVRGFNLSLDELPQSLAENRHYELFWLPGTDRVIEKKLNTVESGQDRPGTWKDSLEYMVENGLLWFFCECHRFFPGSSFGINKAMSKLGIFIEGKKSGSSEQVFASPRKIRFNEMEYAVPFDKGLEAIGELDAWIKKEKIRVSFPAEIRFSQGDDIYLSPSQGRNSIYIAIHQYKGIPYEEYFRGAEKIFRRYQGRPHWGKMHFLEAKDLKELYPNWNSFHNIRRELDPQGIFLNPYLKKLFGVAP